MNKPLYEMADNYMKLMEEIMRQDEISEEQVKALDEVQSDIKEKAVNVAAFIKNLEAEADGIEKAVKAMRERQERASKKINFFMEYLKINLQKSGLQEVKSPFFDIKVKLNPPSVSILDESLIPQGYYNETVVRRLDKAHLSNDLKNNMIVPGVALERRARVEIK